MNEFVIIHTTCAAIEDARFIANSLVSLGLVKCAQISSIQSIYEWHGKICEDDECRVELKALAANFREIEEQILEIHASKSLKKPYDLPEIIAVPILLASKQYSDFLRS